jgi:ATP-dependent Lhr-like helicase
MEENGWARRGMFVAALGAAQFAMTSAIDLLRNLRTDPDLPEVVHLAATDPANPYGAVLPWPREHSQARASGASVVLINGRLAAFLRRSNPAIRTWLPENEPERTQYARALAGVLATVAIRRQTKRAGLIIASIDDLAAREHFLARFLEDAGFINTSAGYLMRRRYSAPVPEAEEVEEDEVQETA